MFGNLGKHLGRTWRSILAVALAYVLVLILFLWAPSLLDKAVLQSHGFHDWLANFIGQFSERGRILFFSTITDFATFMTLLILFVRVVVISLALWISEGLVQLLFGRGE
ncbi:MAG TPA: hypothetical protein VEH07_09890 [Alphaproteobacteria bacterium]|nr:hypothetical protein [Alphaproteobacteria bacterium]